MRWDRAADLYRLLLIVCGGTACRGRQDVFGTNPLDRGCLALLREGDADHHELSDCSGITQEGADAGQFRVR